MNEKGLVVGCLYLPGFASYEIPLEAQLNKSLGPWEVTSFLLSSCASVQDVKAALEAVIVAQQGTPGMGDFVLPLHYYVCDSSGASIVVEYVGGKRFIYENPLGVLTNSPPFPWHLANLTNYMNLSPINVPRVQLRNLKVHTFGQGSGFLGLPGDYTPPSRFVKAAFFSQAAMMPKMAQDAACLGFHILNTFDIFAGVIQRLPEMKDGQVENLPPNQGNLELTQWAVVYDRTNLKSYVRSYGSLSVQMVDLKKINFALPGKSQIMMKKEFVAEDVTTKTVALFPN
jgi:choloylglycine hydrolase